MVTLIVMRPKSRVPEPKAFDVLVLLCLCLSPYYLRAQHLAVSNPLNLDRTQEVVDLSLQEVMKHAHASDPRRLVVREDDTGKLLPTQTYGVYAAQPDRFLILVRVPAMATLHLTVRSEANPPAVTPLVFGREAPERKDDFAWENMLVAYRVYGPALQATGEITSGIDVWSKRAPNFVIDSFYKRDHEGVVTNNKALSYHKDNGVGLDSYQVGPSRGCGGTAVLADGNLFVSKNYSTMKILSSGPIRFAFEVGYAPWDAGGTEVTETKRVVLDAGSRMNQIASTFTFDGGKQIYAAAGLALHKGAEAEQLANDDALSVWDTPQDASAGRIATGMVSTDNHRAMIGLEHALMIFPVKSGQTIHYAAGSGWSKDDMPTQTTWNDYLKLYLAQERSPLKVRWKRGK